MSDNIEFNYPFIKGQGRHSSRLLFDFSIAISAIKEDISNRKNLDFACGTGWTSELLNRICSLDVYGTDIDLEAIEFSKKRALCDNRIDLSKYNMSVQDGHVINFENGYFSHIFCFDSLHHMRDYTSVFQEMYRVLQPGGRAIFVEPGSCHSQSPETINFLKENNFGDWWIEKDVNLIEINSIICNIGFKPLFIKPFLLPSMVDYTLNDWIHIKDNQIGINNHLNELRRFNYENRVIFYFDKP